ncbi:alpha amylase N-terminal ig-like domain-containing protein [Haliovirga abyssi]|uniref:Glycosyl hydrolase family 13 catalytic domain-containing protein n=1 Tax=Haliovirga abyssi TaxID=2996794 RepID=A0AAU9D5W9_9FUSO|nr:alpha amylase N-terminal ig-like domain-containing protein [Haliovirga abyssi]BDU51461.1 hypothetical protein HLVA_20300 [Haliovirga abyssi]
MNRILRVFTSEKKLYKEINLEKINNGIYIGKWHNVETDGAYSFEIIKKESNEKCNITFSHTAPFSKIFEAYTSKLEQKKPVGGIKSGDDILIIFDIKNSKVSLKKMRFTKFVIDTKRYGYENPKKVEMPSNFNGWNIHTTVLTKISNSIFETYLALDEGVYEYKLVIDGDWVPFDNNLKLIVGEIGSLFPKGEIGNGKFVYDAIDKNNKIKAIVHIPHKLDYLNKVEDDIEFSIRTQENDVEKIFLHLLEEDGIEEVYELERINSKGYQFDYFKRIIKFRINSEKFKYYFELKDGNKIAYYTPKGLVYDTIDFFEVDYATGEFPIFDVPKWAKEAIWYNIFPERFYNGNKENDPLYNEFGPENFIAPNKRSDDIEKYKWGIYTDKFGEFKLNNWTSDFETKLEWEEKREKDVGYSVKYSRMYGGDLQGIKEKIPYLKELGVNAIWLNPIFFADSNHKYGTSDFRHVSPDFGTIKMTGKDYNIKVSKENRYGNKTYLDILTNGYEKESELKLLRVKIQGENKGKNGYFETENPETWVWTESDLIAVDLIKELHKNGIRVIFDGVFNHTGKNHWSFELAMAEGVNSKYAKWYKFHDFSKFKEIKDDMSEEEAYKTLLHNKNSVHYSGWAGFNDLPEFNTYNKEYMEYIFNITKKWLLGPDGKNSENWMEDDGIDGFRLDVPNCVENQYFWQLWRKVVKDTKKDAYITAELWGDARSDINDGVKYDTVMNYEWLKSTIGYFINQGKEFNASYKLTAEQFFNELKEKRYWYPIQSLQVSQNLNGSHDTDRLLSRIVNDKLGRDLEEGKQLDKGYNTKRPDLTDNSHKNTTINWKKSEIKPKDILKLISIFQMTYIGAPMLYYGDEVGMWGATDPYCRKPMLWEEFDYENETDGTLGVKSKENYKVKPDKEFFSWYKKIIKIRKENSTLIYGEFKEIYWDNEKDIISYSRFDDENHFLIILNNSFENQENIVIPTDFQDEKFIDLLNSEKLATGPQGNIIVNLDKKTGKILKKI